VIVLLVGYKRWGKRCRRTVVHHHLRSASLPHKKFRHYFNASRVVTKAAESPLRVPCSACTEDARRYGTHSALAITASSKAAAGYFMS
jgi:hypothetical protein